jgi:hypothetical protein
VLEDVRVVGVSGTIRERAMDLLLDVPDNHAAPVTPAILAMLKAVDIMWKFGFGCSNCYWCISRSPQVVR